MPQTWTYRRTIQQAAEYAGGDLNLSVRLSVDLETIRGWMDGRVDIPDQAFLDAVDLITIEKLRADSPLISIKKPKID